MIYIDKIFFISTFMNSAALITASHLCKIRITIKRCILVAVLGSFAVCLYYVSTINSVYQNWGAALIYAVDLFCGLYFHRNGMRLGERIQLFLYTCFCVFIMTCLFGGLIYAAGIIPDGGGTSLMLIVSLLLCILIIIAGRISSKQQKIYKVIYRCGDYQSEGRGLLDTGNMLYEPITGRAVILVKKDRMYDKLIEQYPERQHIIPFSSVGCGRGHLTGIRLDYIEIETDKGLCRSERIVAAGYEPVQCTKDYDIILHNDLLK